MKRIIRNKDAKTDPITQELDAERKGYFAGVPYEYVWCPIVRRGARQRMTFQVGEFSCSQGFGFSISIHQISVKVDHQFPTRFVIG